MMTRALTLSIATAAALLAGCTATTTSLTGRTQLNLVSDAQIASTVDQYYDVQRMQAKNAGKLITSGPQYNQLVDITNRLIEQAVRVYPESRDWKWDLSLIDDRNTENAFCFHGGKMGFYTGFFYKSKVTPDEIAQIMGHEIAHALAGHSKEKMSLSIASKAATELGTQLLGQVTGNRQMTSTALSMASTAFVTLPNGRQTEMEADHIGAELAARAGFNPAAGAALWDKISASEGKSSDFFSTHPSHDKRAEHLREFDKALQPVYAVSKKRAYAPYDWLNGDPQGRPVVAEAQRVKLIDAKTPPTAQELDAQASVRLIPTIAPAVAAKPQIQPPAPVDKSSLTKPATTPKGTGQKGMFTFTPTRTAFEIEEFGPDRSYYIINPTPTATCKKGLQKLAVSSARTTKGQYAQREIRYRGVKWGSNFKLDGLEAEYFDLKAGDIFCNDPNATVD